MDRDNMYRKNIQELDLKALAQLCSYVSRNRFANRQQTDTAHALRVEWVQLALVRRGDTKAEEDFLRNRMAEFLAAVPTWMTSGIQ